MMICTTSSYHQISPTCQFYFENLAHDACAQPARAKPLNLHADRRAASLHTDTLGNRLHSVGRRHAIRHRQPAARKTLAHRLLVRRVHRPRRHRRVQNNRLEGVAQAQRVALRQPDALC